MSDSPSDKKERALWLADKLVGDYGSEAAQLLRWFASAPSAIGAPAMSQFASKADYEAAMSRPISEVSLPMAEVLSTPCPHCGKTPLEAMASTDGGAA